MILDDMLSKISDEFDKSEGSFFYDLLKPVADKLEEAYKLTESIKDKGFIDTTYGEFLDKKVAEVGLERKEASKSFGIVTITGEAGAEIRKGMQVASDNLFFRILEDKLIPASKEVDIKVECETHGAIGNIPIGAIKTFPVTLKGLTSVTNLSAFTGGYDEETDESLRERYYSKVRRPSTSGNVQDYINWASEVEGVGGVKVIPLANGNGTVKVVIINSNSLPADEELIEKVKENIEEKRPIGATVSVSSATVKDIIISVDLIVDSKNYNVEIVKEEVRKAIDTYIKAQAFKSDYISYARLGSVIFNVLGVADYRSLTLNNSTENVSISNTEIAVFREVTYV
ncbi:baseplate J/gp47 family protein [Clostridium sp.]|uniref:baseplate J/gp47 family protein n=1 Tax=Clostridium sp. TaxID=1506 RepID=UPI0039915742